MTSAVLLKLSILLSRRRRKMLVAQLRGIRGIQARRLEVHEALRNRAAHSGGNENRVRNLHGISATANDNSCIWLVAK
jgi:hypothetical protein